MIPRDLIEKIAGKMNIEEKSLVEKDLYLQGLLIELSKNSFFAENFAFKGGTCLTKAYFGHYRFSEDLDFTWMNQKEFEGKTENQVRGMLSEKISAVMQILADAAEKLELDFKGNKASERFVQLGAGGRFATFKLWYSPANNEPESFIKIQLNFVEKILFKPRKLALQAIAEDQKKELELEYPQFAALAVEKPVLFAYSLEEIAAEKIRALLTRRGFKARDLIDLYVLSKKQVTIQSVKKEAVEKTKFMLKYLKYEENLRNKRFEEKFFLGKEQNLLIKQLGNDFEAFANNALKELNDLAEEIRQNKLT